MQSNRMTQIVQTQIVKLHKHGARSTCGDGGSWSRYDSVPYAGVPSAGAHCRRLETIATLFNLTPVPLCSARILDLGCGMGAGLLPQALEYPTARFIGCDGAGTAIAHASELVKTLGLRNVELWHRNLCAANASWGEFDYILCNGVFSWVGPEVRQRILEILRNNLSPQGIAYVSFNTLPGCRLRGVVRELMRHHSAQFDEPQQAVAQARAMLALTAESQTDDSPFANLVREGYMCLSQADDSYLYHEMLAEINQPFYFQAFVGQVESAGLQYLGDADVPRMFTCDLPPTAQTFLEGMPLVVREQYLDFLRGSSFRKSLLCHKEAEIHRRLDHRLLNRFAVSLGHDARLERPEAGAGEAWRLTIGSCEIPCPDPGVVAPLRHLDERRPEFVSVAELRKLRLAGLILRTATARPATA